MTDDQKQPDDKFNSAREASSTEDVVAPTSDDALNDALEDTFPASDPINFAGSSAGRSAENAENEPPENPPVGTIRWLERASMTSTMPQLTSAAMPKTCQAAVPER